MLIYVFIFMYFNLLVCVVLTRLILFRFYGIFFLTALLILAFARHSPCCCNSLRLYLTFCVLDLYESMCFYLNVIHKQWLRWAEFSSICIKNLWNIAGANQIPY